MNMADVAGLFSPIQLVKCWLCNRRSGIVVEKNWALSIDRYLLQAFQFSVHLIDLLSILRRCNGFVRIQKAVEDGQQTTKQ